MTKLSSLALSATLLIRYRTLWVGHWDVAKKYSSASKPADPQSSEAPHKLSLMWGKTGDHGRATRISRKLIA